MINYLKPNDADSIAKRYTYFFIGSMLVVLLAAVISFLLFPVRSGLVSVFFASFSLIPAIETILEKNKNDIWQQRTSPVKANLDMAASLMVIFFAVMLAYILIILIMPNSVITKLFFSQINDTLTHTHLVSNNLSTIIKTRFLEIGLFFATALIFRIGGVFILVWLASVWGVIYGLYIKQGFSMTCPTYKHYMIAIGLWGVSVLLIRTLSSITACMGGLFLSKAFAKYKMNSKEFKQVLKAVVVLLICSLIVLMIAVGLEYKLYH